MISEKKLAYYEHVSVHTCSQECQKIITQLVDEVRKLERDADWLAKKHWPRCPAEQMIDDCKDGMSPENCRKCWREYARKESNHD